MVWVLSDADAQLGAVSRSRCKQLHPSLGQKKFNLVTWLPCRAEETGVGLLVLGDSYADNFDMGFECWQTLLGRQSGLSSLNVACGGARISQFRDQLGAATAACSELGLRPGAETLVVIHAGGNDFLQALVLPPLLLLLLADILRCAVRRLVGAPRYPAASPPLLSFVGLSARWLALQLRLLVAALHRLGYRRVLVSGPIITSSLPLARAVVTVLMLGLVSTAFVDATLRDLGEILAASLRDDTLPRLEAQYRHENAGMRLAFFDGADEITQLAAAAAEERHGVAGTLRLLSACRRPTPHTTFWRDGHHPTAPVHAELALRARASLSSSGLVSGKAPVGRASALASPHEAARGEAPQAPLLGS